jgi:hypothetical protein
LQVEEEGRPRCGLVLRHRRNDRDVDLCVACTISKPPVSGV